MSPMGTDADAVEADNGLASMTRAERDGFASANGDEHVTEPTGAPEVSDLQEVAAPDASVESGEVAAPDASSRARRRDG